MQKTIKDSIKNGCVLFTIITVISYSIGVLISTETKAYIPTLKSIYIYLAFSILFSLANRLLGSKKMNTFFKILIHYIITGTLFFCVFVFGGGFAENGFITIIFIAAYTVIYIIGSLLFTLFHKKNERKEIDKKQYDGLFK